MPGADAPGKFARSNAREAPGKLQLQTEPFARSKPLNPWQIFGGSLVSEVIDETYNFGEKLTIYSFIFPLPSFILLCAVHSSSFLHSSTHAGNGRRGALIFSISEKHVFLPSFTLVTAAAVLHQPVWSFFVLLLEAVFAVFSIAQETTAAVHQLSITFGAESGDGVPLN
ncbi:transmembrane protein, putative [Medicago truncatula]|uniref:Transmembrane protein, putative n=1 Tax=Medicago truncatula TaxID=3880 RepID=A0A072VUA1_MEDTR|nr:transmembrane protein, putative [Medicago truncatula]